MFKCNYPYNRVVVIFEKGPLIDFLGLHENFKEDNGGKEIKEQILNKIRRSRSANLVHDNYDKLLIANGKTFNIQQSIYCIIE